MPDDKVTELLMEMQYDFPLVERPFMEIGLRIGVSEDWVLDKVKEMLKSGRVRRIGALVNYRARGLVSALVALKVRDEDVDRVASEVNRDSQVTHNFLRRHNRYNMWYVTKAGTREELESKVASIVAKYGIEDYVILYSERTYKIDVKFDIFRGVSRAKVRRIPPSAPKISEVGLPIEFFEMIRSIKPIQEPFREISEKLNIPTGKLTELIVRLRDMGVIRDFYATIDPELNGFVSNAMVVFNTQDCEAVADIEEATHVVKRSTIPGKWNYNCYFMIHATSDDIISGVVKDRLSRLGINNYELIFSIRNLLPEMARRLEAV